MTGTVTVTITKVQMLRPVPVNECQARRSLRIMIGPGFPAIASPVQRPWTGPGPGPARVLVKTRARPGFCYAPGPARVLVAAVTLTVQPEPRLA